jgi:hypothetical protein
MSRPTTGKASSKRVQANNPAQIQISARAQVPIGRVITKNIIAQAIEYRLDTGQDPPGIELEIVSWRGKEASGQYSQDELWRRFGPLLRASKFQVGD